MFRQVLTVLRQCAFGVVAPAYEVGKGRLRKLFVEVPCAATIDECSSYVGQCMTREHDAAQRPRLGPER